MITVIVERHIKEEKNLSQLLQELRILALNQPGHGYVSSQTLVDTEDSSVILVISTWQSLEDWRAWETSEDRTRVYQEIEPLLAEKPRVRICSFIQ